MKQAIRVNDDDQDDGGMGAAGYVATLFLVIGFSLLIAVALWLPELAQWWGWL